MKVLLLSEFFVITYPGVIGSHRLSWLLAGVLASGSLAGKCDTFHNPGIPYIPSFCKLTFSLCLETIGLLPCQPSSVTVCPVRDPYESL